MSYEPKDYWSECLVDAFDACGVEVTETQIAEIAASVSVGHENYGMAFYSPPASDRIYEIEREWKAKHDRLQAEFDKYRGNAEVAVKQALRQSSDANVSIGEYGEVFRHGGRTEQIQ